MKIVLAGGTGFVGRALREGLHSAGHEVIVLTRKKSTGETGPETCAVWDGLCPGFSKRVDKDRPNFRPNFCFFSIRAVWTALITFVFKLMRIKCRSGEIDKYWDGRTPGDWMTHLDGADAVINLAGENVAAKRWTAVRKQEILSSRVDATRAIVNAVAQARKKPPVLINASAVGYYGDVPEGALTEASGAGDGFLTATCERWEAEARKAELSGTRVVLARLGPVLGEKGGMLSKMLPPFQFFMGVPLGTGQQWIPWVHRDDVTGAFLFMIEHGDMSGPVNVTAPVPVTMQEFCSTLAKILRRPCWFSIPGFLLKILMGEMAALVLSSQKALPEKLLRAGYRFRYVSLPEAFEAILLS